MRACLFTRQHRNRHTGNVRSVDAHLTDHNPLGTASPTARTSGLCMRDRGRVGGRRCLLHNGNAMRTSDCSARVQKNVSSGMRFAPVCRGTQTLASCRHADVGMNFGLSCGGYGVNDIHAGLLSRCLLATVQTVGHAQMQPSAGAAR
jgi:hypothetical protein